MDVVVLVVRLCCTSRGRTRAVISVVRIRCRDEKKKKSVFGEFSFRSGILVRDDGSRNAPSLSARKASASRAGKRARRRAYETSRGARRVKVSNEAVRTHHRRGARADGRARGRDTVTRARVRENSSRFGDISRENECVVDAGGIARTVVVLAGDVTHVGVKEWGRMRENKRAVRGEGRRSSGVRLGAFREWRRERLRRAFWFELQ